MARPYPASVIRLLKACEAEVRNSIDTKDELALADVLLPMAEAIYDPDGPRSSGRKKIKPREVFLERLFFDFRELIAAYQILVDFPTLARSRPPRSQGLSPARLASFWREAYLNELYIFLCRVDAYMARIVRNYRRERSLAALPSFLTHMRELINSRLGDFIEMRGGHVHRRRYEYTDPELHRLQLLEMLATGSKIPEFRKLYREAARTAKVNNTETFRLITREAKDCLKGVFDSFEGFMLDREGRLVYPSNLKT